NRFCGEQNRFCSIRVTRIDSWYGEIDSEEAGILSEMLESIPGAKILKFPSTVTSESIPIKQNRFQSAENTLNG
ncbi:hypothetical protein PIB30_103728, partial [Stylosanthes scabra]|nr:hypothetical protein [Stylosanthes scabra]